MIKSSANVEKKLSRYFYLNKGVFSMLVIADLGTAISLVVWSFFMKSLADTGIDGNIDKLISLIYLGIFFLIFFFIVNYFRYYCRRVLLKKINSQLKDDVFNSVLSKDINSFNATNSAKYISILNNDISKIETDYFINIPNMLNNLITCIIATIALFIYSPLIGIVTIISSSITLIIPKLYGDKVSKKQNKYFNYLEIYNSKIKDIFNGFEIIKGFNIDNEIKFQHKNHVSNLEGLQSEFRKASYNSYVLQSSLHYIGCIIQLVFSIYLVLIGNVTFGVLLGTMQVSNYVFNPIKSLSEDFLTLKSIKHIKDKVEVIINSSCETEVQECKEEVEVSTPIELKNLTYTYDGGNIGLKNINFQFEKGRKYALVGSSGSGKSTLVKLIMKYYNDYDGEILIGNKSLKHIDKSSLYKYYSIIPQKVMLFNDTLKNNISMFQTYSDEDIYNVIRDVNLEHIVKDLPDELNTIVSESGNNFSGGEQQRISLARSFLKNSEVMLIDEATSSLDNKNSNQIEELILQRDNLTAIVVTHKLNENILQKYDCIVLLNDGEIAEYGSFTELMNRKQYFYSLYTLNSLHSYA